MPDQQGSRLALLFNGRWGKDNKVNEPPYGPPLHGNWT
jgi:hypothetical protein